MDPFLIDYRRLARAIDFYEKLGYELIEVPWAVGKAAMDVTAPEGAELDSLGNQYLVASAEQAFIEKMLFEWSPNQILKNMALTPCFRNETVLDDYHRRYFMKLELIVYGKDVDQSDLVQCILDASDFMRSEIPTPEDLKVTTGSRENELDLEYLGVELGSYGIRGFGPHRWVYGTGLAEPRFTTALTF